MLMCIQNFAKFCPLVLKIFSGNEILTSIKGHDSVANLQKTTLYNPNLNLINVTGIQNLAKFCPLILKILSGNEILTSFKGRNSVANLRTLTLYNFHLDSM